MSSGDPLVSIGLPVFNAGSRVAEVVRSVLAQDYTDIEMVISDNGSTDDTEAVCRELARSDSRISYHRQPKNIGLLNNFMYAMGAAKGTYFRWIGDDDRLEPTFVSSCLATFQADPRLILVSTGIAYDGLDGTVDTPVYTGTALASDDPVERFSEMLRLVTAGRLFVDPLYSLMQRATVAAIPRRNMLREDEVFATKLALAGPWGHRPEILAHRVWKKELRLSSIGQVLGVPSWQRRFATTLQVREILGWLRQTDLTDEQRRRARAAVYGMYVTRQSQVARHRAGKLIRLAVSR